jgi:hypothetical protein
MKRWLARTQTAADFARLAPIFLALRLAKRLVPIERLARWSWRDSRSPVRDQTAEQRVISSVVRLGALAGRPERDCIERSLLLYRELSRAGADPRLVVGFRSEGGHVKGHAWVEADGVAIAETAPRNFGFERMWSFGPSGQPFPH